MTQERTESKQTLEIEEQEQESALDALLRKVDINDPLEIKDHAGNIVEVSQEKFMEYYMPQGTSKSDAFHCMQAVRGTGLSLFAPGECYFFKTGGGPVKLFTGYTAYLRKAYAAGLEHIEKPVLDFANDAAGYPVSCTITIHITDRENMEWTTWFAEVAGKQGNALNSRWLKAPIQMLIKCAIVNILRLSGLVDFTMPYTVDEMDDPTVPGFRTLTQPQLDGYEEQQEAPEVGKVSATHHQNFDFRPCHKQYRGMLNENSPFKDDAQRKLWQESETGKASSADFGLSEWLNILSAYKDGAAHKWVESQKPEPDPPGGGGLADQPRYHKDKPGEMIGAKTAEELKDADDNSDFDPETEPVDGMSLEAQDEEAASRAAFQEAQQAEREKLRDQFMKMLIVVFPNQEDRYKWIANNIGLPVNGIDIWGITYYEQGIDLLGALQSGAGNAEGGEGSQEPEKGQEGATEPAERKITNATKSKLGRLVREWPETPYTQTIKTQTFKKRAEKDIGPYDDINNITEVQGLELLASLSVELAEITGEIVDDDPLGVNFLGPDIPWIQQFKDKAVLRFTPADSSKFVEWKRYNDLDGVKVDEWDDDTAKRGIALLEGVPLLESAQEEFINQGQRDQIDKLLPGMPERFHGSTGSESFRNFAKTIKPDYNGLPGLTEEEASDVIHQMQDMVETEGIRKEKAVADRASMFE